MYHKWTLFVKYFLQEGIPLMPARLDTDSLSDETSRPGKTGIAKTGSGVVIPGVSNVRFEISHFQSEHSDSGR
jgi:hypothetical protein